MTILVASIFLVWCAVSVIYILKPSILGRWASPFHRFGWVNNWNMFVTNPVRNKAKFVIKYRDLDEAGDISLWNEVPKETWYLGIFVINIQGRLMALYTVGVRRILKLNSSGVEDLKTDPIFRYLCQVICDFPSQKPIKARQIKFDYIEVDKELQEIVLSDFISIK